MTAVVPRRGAHLAPRRRARTAPERRRSGLAVVVHAVALGAGIGALAIVALLALVLVVVPKATGSLPLTVLTRSMEPTLPAGTLVVVRPTAAADVRVGNVLTYQLRSGDPTVVTHRVVAVTTASDGSRRFQLKGDANPAPDPADVLPVQVRGVVWYSVPWVGWVNQAVNGSRPWLVPTLAGLLIAYGAVSVASGGVEAARRRRRPARHARRVVAHGTISGSPEDGTTARAN